jgi:hypothetical protein
VVAGKVCKTNYKPRINLRLNCKEICGFFLIKI